MNNMNKLIAQFNQLSRNIRWLLFAVIAFILFWIWCDVLCKPLYQHAALIKTRMITAAQDARQLKADYKIYEHFLHAPPTEAAQHIATLKKQLANLKKNILLSKETSPSLAALEPLLQAIAKAPPGIEIQQLQLDTTVKLDSKEKRILLKF